MEKGEDKVFPNSDSPPVKMPETHEETKEKFGGENQPPSIATLVEDEVESPVAAEEWEYVTGIKLTVVLIAVCAACFIMLLDTSIVVTVSVAFPNQHPPLSFTKLRRFRKLPVTFIRWRI